MNKSKTVMVFCIIGLFFISMSAIILYQGAYSDGFEDGYVEGFNDGYLYDKDFVSVEIIETATFLNVPITEIVITDQSLECFDWRKSGDTHQTLFLKVERGVRIDITFKYFINKTWNDIMPDTEFREKYIGIGTKYIGIIYTSILYFEGFGEIELSISCKDWSD